MPVQRYRRVEDVPPPAALDPSDPVAMERVWGLLRLATDGLALAFPPGVRRYRSIEAADAERREAEIARMRRLREGALGFDRTAGTARAADPHG
jgi:hypothetical protein